MKDTMATADQPDGAPRGLVAKRANADEIHERYLRRAISEVNELGDELLALGDELHVPVLGSGHPLGDIMLLKHSPTQSEIHEGVAFFGRAGQALLKSLERLSRRPARRLRHELPQVRDGGAGARRGPGSTRELHIVQPKLLVAMGDETVAFVNALELPPRPRARRDAGRASCRASRRRSRPS